MPSLLYYLVFYAWIGSGGIQQSSSFSNGSSTILVSAYKNSSSATSKNIMLAEATGTSLGVTSNHGKKNLRGEGQRPSNYDHIRMNDSRQLAENHDDQSLELPTLSSANSYTTSSKHRNLTNIHELVDRPIDQWDLQDWIFLLIVLFIISMIFRIFSRIGCCGCSLMDCLTCWFCWELFCDPSPGMDYGLC